MLDFNFCGMICRAVRITWYVVANEQGAPVYLNFELFNIK